MSGVDEHAGGGDAEAIGGRQCVAHGASKPVVCTPSPRAFLMCVRESVCVSVWSSCAVHLGLALGKRERHTGVDRSQDDSTHDSTHFQQLAACARGQQLAAYANFKPVRESEEIWNTGSRKRFVARAAVRRDAHDDHVRRNWRFVLVGRWLQLQQLEQLAELLLTP